MAPTPTSTPVASPAAGPATDHPPQFRGPRVVLLVGSLVLAILAFQLNASLLSPALPRMAEDLRVSTGAISQVQSLFFLSGSVLGMVISRWSDTIGRRRALLLCLAAIVVGSVLAVTAPSLPLLLAGRVLQGASAATFTIAFLVLAEELTAKQFGISVGVVTAVNGGLGGLDGYIGGAVTESLGWRALFVIILAVSVLAVAFVLGCVPARGRAVPARMDWWGAAILATFLVCLTRFITTASVDGLTDATTIGFFLGAAAAAVAFVLVERRIAQPLIAVSALRARTVWPVLLCTFLTVAGMFAATNFTVVILSQDQQVGYGLGATLSGLLYLTPTALVGVLAAIGSGWVSQRIGWVPAMRLSTGALVLVSAAVAVFAMNRWVVFGLLIAAGVFYLGQFQSTSNGLSVLNSPADAPGSLPGINGSCFGLGAGAGIAMVAPLVGLGTADGYRTALWVTVALVAGAFLSSLILRPAPAALAARHTPKA